MNAFTTGIAQLKPINARPLRASTLRSTQNSCVRVFRELEKIDLIIEFPEKNVVVAIENKIWAAEQPKQIERYQNILISRYSEYNKVLIYLTPDGKQPITANSGSTVPVYCMSYKLLVEILKSLSCMATESASFFIEQFISHVERYMSGSTKTKKLCWEIFEQHEDAYMHMMKSYSYCFSKKIRNLFESMQKKIEKDSMFKDWNNDITIDLSDQEDKKNIIECDLNIRLNTWPEGLWIKVYKHGWFGVFPFTTKKNLPKIKAASRELESFPYIKVQEWDDLYYVSRNQRLDKERKILDSGNDISENDIPVALNKVKEHIMEINNALTDI